MSRPFYKSPKVQNNDTKTGNAPDDYGDPLAFDAICETIDIIAFDYPAIIKRTPDGTNWDDEIEIPANVFRSITCKTHSINIKNKTAESTARYEIVGYY